MSGAAQLAVLGGRRPIRDLRDVIRSRTFRGYWRSDDIQVMGALGVTSRMARFVGGVDTGGGDIVPSGALTRYIPIRLTITSSGGYGAGQCTISCDGGFTPTMTGVTIVGTPVALTGPGVGTSLSFSNVSYTSGDVFENGHEYWPDRSPNGKNLIQPVSTYYNAVRLRDGRWLTGVGEDTIPTAVKVAVTGPAGAGGGVGNYVPAVNMTMPAPGTTPTYVTGVLATRTISGGSSYEKSIFIGSGTNKFRLAIRGDGQVSLDNGTTRVWPSYTFSKWGKFLRFRAYFSNSAADFVTLGGDHTTLSSCGNNSDTTFAFGRSVSESTFGSDGAQGLCECAVLNGLPTANELALEEVYYAAFYKPGILTI